MARFRTTTTAEGNTYLQFVESYRNRKGIPATRVLASLANITKMSEDQVDRLTTSFIRAAGTQEKYRKLDFEAGKGFHYGSALPVMAIWHQLGLGQIIDNAVAAKVNIPVSRIALIQTANRFSDPGSKLACFRWYFRSVFSQMKNFIEFSGDDDEKAEEEQQLHTFYRALDYLSEAKEKIEKELYWRLLGYGVDSSLILYDITSTYFEGAQAELGKKGHSRDHRPDLDQIVVGLVMSRDGIPLAHHVFEGNRLDKTTVAEVVSDLEERFGIKKAIFVGDRGMITADNIESIKGHEYDYILGLQKRNRKLVDHLLPKVFEKPDELIQEFGYEDLSEKLQKKHDEKVRIVACYNPEVAKKTGATRERNRALFQELVNSSNVTGDLENVKKVNDKLTSFLYRKHITKFYKLEIEKVSDVGEEYKVSIQEIPEAIENEEQLDGRYFIQTEVSKKIDPEEIRGWYKSLQKVERAFDIVKHLLDMRPMHVRKDRRVRGHVMIIYFSLLVETLTEKKLRGLYPQAYDGNKEWIRQGERTGEEPLSMMTLHEELDGVRLIPLQFKTSGEKSVATTYISTKIDANVKKLLSVLGVRNAMRPEKLSFRAWRQGGDDRQLELDLGAEYLK
ncbi:MAG: IS1634 family transposase [Nitrospinaceae bacterium]|jgi:transposase|nr:IS1634 family transposase [Pirellulales bacterium]MDP7611961.1 IS1634 family transposase [Nitrospinaceae bacterium]